MPIALIFMFAALAIITPTLMSGVQQDNQLIIDTVAAKQLHQMTDAAKAYITINASNIERQPMPFTISFGDLERFLPQGFSEVNPFGQTWEVQVLQTSPGNLQALVISYGGNAVNARIAGQIAQIAGASGGVIGGGSGEYAVPNCSSGEACGAYGGWSVSTSGYQNILPGHLVGLIGYSNGQLQSDYLYRVAVPGQPQLNQMQTNLDMGTNSVNNANEVNAQSETLASGEPNGQPGSLQIGSNYYYGDGSNAAVRTPGGFYVQNQNGSGAASINEVDNVNASGNITTPDTVQGGYVNSTGNVNAQNALTAGSNWWANSSGDSSQSGNLYAGGQIHAGYDVWLGTANGTANQGSGCSDYGEIAASANYNGQVLMCNGSSWQAMLATPDYPSVKVIAIGYGQNNNVYLGNYIFCASDGLEPSGTNTTYNPSGTDAIYPLGGMNGNGQYAWYASSSGGRGILAICFN